MNDDELIRDHRQILSRQMAEIDRVRAAIRKIRATDNITAVWHIADGALAPSPKG